VGFWHRGFSETLTAPVRYGGVMHRYPPSLWDTVRAAIGCAAVLAVVLEGPSSVVFLDPLIFFPIEDTE
jgi:hypothetical protein